MTCDATLRTMKSDSGTNDWVVFGLEAAAVVMVLGLGAIAGWCGVHSSDVGSCVRGRSFRLMSLGLYGASLGLGYIAAKVAASYMDRQWVIGAVFWTVMLGWVSALVGLGFPIGGD